MRQILKGVAIGLTAPIWFVPVIVAVFAYYAIAIGLVIVSSAVSTTLHTAIVVVLFGWIAVIVWVL